jgi:hypothetical protein
MGRTCAPSAAKEQETSSSMVPGAWEQAPGPPLRTSNHAAAHTRQRRVQNRNCDTSKFVAARHPYQYDTSIFQRLRASHAILSTIMKRAFSTLCLNRARVRCGRLKQQQQACILLSVPSTTLPQERRTHPLIEEGSGSDGVGIRVLICQTCGHSMRFCCVRKLFFCSDGLSDDDTRKGALVLERRAFDTQSRSCC